MQGDKRQPYEENIRVPLIVRGPDVPANARTSSIALSIDLVSSLCLSCLNIFLDNV